MEEKTTYRISTFNLWLWIPASLIGAVIFFLVFDTDSGLTGQIIWSLLIGGGGIGIALSWLISLCWNIIGTISNRKSGSITDALQCGAGFHEWPDWKYMADGNCMQIRRCPICGEEEEQVEHEMGDFHYACAATLVGSPALSSRFETLLSERFNQSDLRDFCFQNGIDPENLEGDSKIENIQSLLRLHNKNRSVNTLLDMLKSYRAEIADEIEEMFPLSLSRVVTTEEAVCLQHAHCARCGHIEQETEHFYTDWVRAHKDKCDFVKNCQRCSEQESKTEHRWSGEQYEREGSCRQQKVCLTCGEKKTTIEKHIYQEHTEQNANGMTVKVKICTRCGDRN